MFRMLKAVVALAGLVALCQVGAVASGSRAPSPSSPAMSPEEIAVQAYNSGIDHRDKGAKLELQASSAAAKDRDKVMEKAKKEYANALKEFKRATDNSPKMFQAFNGMGFAYRKTGDYVKALENYDKAISMPPGFPDAIEYRGEAYLGLNRIDDAKQAYLDAVRQRPAQADVLMAAMKKWVEQRKADPAGVDPGRAVGVREVDPGARSARTVDRADGPDGAPHELVVVQRRRWLDIALPSPSSGSRSRFWRECDLIALPHGAASMAPPASPPADPPFVVAAAARPAAPGRSRRQPDERREGRARPVIFLRHAAVRQPDATRARAAISRRARSPTAGRRRSDRPAARTRAARCR